MTDGSDHAAAAEQPPFEGLVDLASARFGGRVLHVNDEFFAPGERLLLPEEPVFREGEYTDRGKWMDGWETRRRREPGHDRCLVRLGLPGVIRGVEVSTRHFRGNHPEACSLEARAVASEPEPAELAASEEGWREIVPRSPLEGDAVHAFPVEAEERFTHLRFHIYPDGGVARLRVYGEVRPDWDAILSSGGAVDLAGVQHGGRVVSASDGTFADPANLILPGPAEHMGDGWETRRRRGPGHDWTILALGRRGVVAEVVVDTSHFRGNYPESCSLEVVDAGGSGPGAAESGPDAAQAAAPEADDPGWTPLLPRTKLDPDARHRFREELADVGPATHVRFRIFPDGGVARLRIRGRPVGDVPAGKGSAGDASVGKGSAADAGPAARLDALGREEAAAALRSCCASERWVEGMLEARPFGDDERLMEEAERVWWELEPEDWLEAFEAHPRIGEREPSGGAAAHEPGDETAEAWSREEQSGVEDSAEETRRALEEGNRRYEERFGHVFLIFASGRSGEEMLAELKRRLDNESEEELRIAAGEQDRITRHRLRKLTEEEAQG